MTASRNTNPLNFLNGQHPQTFNQLAVGSKGLMGQSSNTFDNNSLDRMIQMHQAQDMRTASQKGSKKIRQQTMIQNNQMAAAYNENIIISPQKLVVQGQQSKQNKRTSSLKDSSQQQLMQQYIKQQGLHQPATKQNRNTLFIGGNGISGGA
jgi:hypothetical protein